EEIKKREERRLEKIPGGTGDDHCRQIDRSQQNAFECPLHLFLSDRIGETGETGHEVIQHCQSREPARERITPLRELWISKTREDLRNEKQRRHNREHRDDAQEELHSITHEQTKVARHECEYASRE